jgi:sugar phosphate isomerase/epimerase
MMNNPVLISTVAFDGYNLATAIEEIAKVGADGVEVAFIEGYTEPFTEEDFNQTHADEILSHLKKHGIPCPSFSAHMDLTKENGVEIFKRRMIFAHMLGADTIVTNAAPLAKKDEFLSNIIQLGQAAKTIGINIGLENPGDGKANVIDTASQAGPVIDEIALETVGLNYDFGNLISHCFEKVKPEEDYRFALPQTNHYHVKDVVRQGGGWGFCPIGEGMIDYKEILSAIAGDPRPLPVSLEIPLRLARAADAGPIRADKRVDIDLIRQVLKRSMDFVRQTLAA